MTVENKVYLRSTKPHFEPETWTRNAAGQIIVVCRHGHPGMLRGHADASDDWKISDGRPGEGPIGSVRPSVWWKGSCECHVYVRLECWPP